MRKLLLPAAATAALLATIPMTAASAAPTVSAAPHSVLTTGRVGGTNVKVGAILQASLKSGTKAVFAAGPVKVTCKKVIFKAQVTKNPPKRGTATEKLKSQTFSRCSITGVSGTNGAPSVKLNHLPYKTTISDSHGNLVTVSGTNTTITIGTILGGSIKCTYVAKTTKGNASNTSQTIAFSKQAFIRKSGPPTTCKEGLLLRDVRTRG